MPLRMRSQRALATGGTRGSWPTTRDIIRPFRVCVHVSGAKRTGGAGCQNDQGVKVCWFGDRGNFLHSSWYGAAFGVCAENGVDNREVLLSLLSSAYTESRPFLPLTPAHQPVGLGVHKKMAGVTTGTADPN